MPGFVPSEEETSPCESGSLASSVAFWSIPQGSIRASRSFSGAESSAKGEFQVFGLSPGKLQNGAYAVNPGCRADCAVLQGSNIRVKNGLNNEVTKRTVLIKW